MVFYEENGAVKEVTVGSVKVDNVVDTTGCGDSFAGGLGFGLLTHPGDFVRAAKFGNAMGAQRTQGRTFEVFKTQQETIEMILANYGTL